MTDGVEFVFQAALKLEIEDDCLLTVTDMRYSKMLNGVYLVKDVERKILRFSDSGRVDEIVSELKKKYQSDRFVFHFRFYRGINYKYEGHKP